MDWLTACAKNQIQLFACETPEEEACGFVLKDNTAVRVQNIAADRSDQFAIDPKDYAFYDEDILGIWHTHLEFPGFSELDQQVISTDELPWAVYCLSDNSWHQCDPRNTAPFEGRPFVFGVYDCYSLVSDYLETLEVKLPPWPRGSWGEWNTPLFTPFDEEGPKLGRLVKPGMQQAGDMMLMNLGDFPCHTDHLGVFVNGKQFLHHPASSVSRLQTFGGYWQRRLNLIIRPHELWKN
jgi:proteasome lid subunit RPN8/RPN11